MPTSWGLSPERGSLKSSPVSQMTNCISPVSKPDELT
jgi:hypothetical protein